MTRGNDGARVSRSIAKWSDVSGRIREAAQDARRRTRSEYRCASWSRSGFMDHLERQVLSEASSPRSWTGSRRVKSIRYTAAASIAGPSDRTANPQLRTLKAS
jgi:hypothetical protein